MLTNQVCELSICWFPKACTALKLSSRSLHDVGSGLITKKKRCFFLCAHKAYFTVKSLFTFSAAMLHVLRSEFLSNASSSSE